MSTSAIEAHLKAREKSAQHPPDSLAAYAGACVPNREGRQETWAVLERTASASARMTTKGKSWLWLIFLAASVLSSARGWAQSGSAQISLSLTVQSSINLVFNNNAAVGTTGFCPLNNAGTNNVGLDLGSASFPSGSDSLACVAYSKPTGSIYQVSSAFDVLVTKSNSTSVNYRLAAQISTAPPANVTWMASGVTLTNTGFTQLDAADSYGTAVTKSLQVQVKNNVPAQVLTETVTFLATAN